MIKLEILKTPIALFITSLILMTSTTNMAAESSNVKSPKPPADKSKAILSAKDENALGDEIVSREKQEAIANKNVIDAQKAFEADEFKRAITLYLQAIEIFRPLSTSSRYIRRKIKKINTNMAMVYYYWARNEYTKANEDAEMKHYDEAVAKCKEILKMDPTMSPLVEKLMKRITTAKNGLVYKKETDESVVDKDKKARLYQIDVLMAQGRKLYAAKLWHRAREKFEDVLLLDPYNLKAIELIRKLTRYMYSAGETRFKTTVAERNAETAWKRVTPLIPRSLTPVIDTQTPIKKNEATSKIKRKLQDIIINHMEFDEATISAVVDMLRIEAKKQDKEHEGVNILLRLNSAPNLGDSSSASAAGGPAGATAGDEGGDGGVNFLLDDTADAGGDKADAGGDTAAAGGDTAAAGGDTAAAGGDNSDASLSSGSEPTITIMFDDLSLGEAIRNICLAADLKYRVEDYAVVIAAKNVALDNLETRIYPIDSEADMGGAAAGGGDAGDGGGDGGGGGAGTTTSVKSYFEKRGISFPEGSKIVFDSGISRLIATNTPEQLKKIERIIDELNVIDPQVLIECKFVEIQENKAKELGFEWSMAKPVSNNSTSSWNFQQNDAPLRYLNSTNTNGGNDTAFSVQRTDKDGITYKGTIHALDQLNNVDILSTPRITTQNGEEATIRMVTEVYYPDSWGDATLVDSGTSGVLGSVSFASSMPQFSDPTELGVKMVVTPTVDPDKYTISLSLQPVVQQFVDWTDYSYNQQTSLGVVRNTLKMPIIEARTVDTEISVYDGETIVMGGIMRDTVNSINDVVPILGKLPLVGRLFQSKSKTAQKANLLIFVTPRLVTPNGAPLRQREIRGLPPFRM